MEIDSQEVPLTPVLSLATWLKERMVELSSLVIY